MTLVALLAVTTGAWAQTGENIFQYCYDCQRSPAYPKAAASASLSGFSDPLVGYKGSGFDSGNTPAGPWKLEYMGIWSTTDKHEIDDVSNYQSLYNCTDVPVFRLYQWNATANEYQPASYGVVCCYAKVSNAVEHTALFVSQDGWGCVLTNSSHSSSMNVTFDEDLTTGLTTLMAAATPASSATPVNIVWDAAAKTGTFTQPAGNVTVSVDYYPQAAFAMSTDATPVALAPKASTSARANTDDPLVEGGTVAGIVDDEALLEEGQGTLLYHFSATQLDAAALQALTATDWDDNVPTADGLAEGTVYVYYYIKGADDLPGITPGAKFTFSDSDIQELAVTLLPEPTYNVEFAEGTDPNEWTAQPNEGVKKGQTVTVTYTGSKKVLGVKAEKKKVLVTSITLNQTGTIIRSYGDSGTLSVTSVLPEDATDKTYTWSSDDPYGVSIDQNGHWSVVGRSGFVTLRATANDGSGVSASLIITIR